MSYTIQNGDCLDVLKTLDDNSVDSIVTDPPYGLSFMGKAWDHSVPSADVWAECLRVLKPGGHLLAFAGTRTQHRMTVNIEDAGFEIRDMIAWVYGSGFPKSLDVSKAIDKAAGAEREVVGQSKNGMSKAAMKPDKGWNQNNMGPELDITASATEAAKQWQGWGTALKPALEPITVARKPFKGTVANNVLTHGTGAINVDGCRVGTESGLQRPARRGKGQTGGWANYEQALGNYGTPDGQGRWPANFIHDGSDEVVGLFPVTKTGKVSSHSTKGMWGSGADVDYSEKESFGSAARFFYCAKASKKDRDEGVAGVAGVGALRDNGRKSQPRKNTHPTVKPTDLMRYLVRLVTPPNGTVLDPFMGSGSTGKGAVLEGFDFIGIELDADYIEIARARIDAVDPDGVLS